MSGHILIDYHNDDASTFRKFLKEKCSVATKKKLGSYLDEIYEGNGDYSGLKDALEECEEPPNIKEALSDMIEDLEYSQSQIDRFVYGIEESDDD